MKQNKKSCLPGDVFQFPSEILPCLLLKTGEKRVGFKNPAHFEKMIYYFFSPWFISYINAYQ